uniref:Protein FAM136A n=1 Tax=Clastoptera arizonana TaxID=38151 RepID=A0A1B6CYS9_9HEMI
MLEQYRKKIEVSLKDAVEEIDRTSFRKKRIDMFKCSIKCCEDTSLTSEESQECLTNCSVHYQECMAHVQSEMNKLQNRMQRCIMQCNDDVSDNIGSNPTQLQMENYRNQFQSCAATCVNKYMGIIPEFVSRMKEVLSKDYIPRAVNNNS